MTNLIDNEIHVTAETISKHSTSLARTVISKHSAVLSRGLKARKYTEGKAF